MARTVQDGRGLDVLHTPTGAGGLDVQPVRSLRGLVPFISL